MHSTLVWWLFRLTYLQLIPNPEAAKIQSPRTVRIRDGDFDALFGNSTL